MTVIVRLLHKFRNISWADLMFWNRQHRLSVPITGKTRKLFGITTCSSNIYIRKSYSLAIIAYPLAIIAPVKWFYLRFEATCSIGEVQTPLLLVFCFSDLVFGFLKIFKQGISIFLIYLRRENNVRQMMSFWWILI